MKMTEFFLAELDAEVPPTRKVLARMPSGKDDWKPHPKSMPMGYLDPRHVVLRSAVFNHLAHHRGQLTVYLRLNDVPVPAIYGPSADDQRL
jgi:uncharacterized damage-inducible protein DinB